ncbi:hypothetical protein LCGC14_2093790 [marine sediment metagenome]|uniref:Uncharacterized protein n=1 Tax=marine sediment metagenome TaxID=412755 RepID=A0A0F9EC61_9ZZZZ
MWIHLPTSVSTPEEADLTSASSWPFQVLAASVTSSETRRRARSWWTTCKRASWMMRLSGQIPEPSTASHGVEKWIGSLADSPASPGALSANKKEPKMNAGSGLTYGDWFARYDPAESSWKTSQDSFVEELNTFSEGWPHSGTMRNGRVFEHHKWEPYNEEVESSFLPTLAASEWKDFSKASVLATLGDGEYNDRVARAICSNSATLHSSQEMVGLNPSFAEMMMGLEPGWTGSIASESSGTE